MSDRPKQVNLPLSVLRLDPRLQVRADAATDHDHAAALEAAIRAGTSLPRLRVVRVVENDEATNYVVDGHYRAAAYAKAGRTNAPCLLSHGTWLDAVAAAAAANRDQTAKRRTTADTKKAVLFLVAELKRADVRPMWSNGKIGDQVGVSAEFVRRARAETGDHEPAAPEVVGRNGKTIKTRAPAPKPPPPTTPDSWRDAPVADQIAAQPEVIASLAAGGATTCGALYDKLAKGEDFGLRRTDAQDLAAEVQALRDRHEAPASTIDGKAAEPRAAAPNVPWAVWDQRYGDVVRFVDRIAREYGVIDGEDHLRAKDNLADLLANVTAWKKRLVPTT